MTLRQPTPEGSGAAFAEDRSETARIDKWLWQARLFKTRGLATREIAAGRVRINGQRITRPSRTVRPGDTLTFRFGNAIAVVRIRAIGNRRGPATEARTLYDLLEEAAPAGAKVAIGQDEAERSLNEASDRITSTVPKTGNADQ